jgi:hypothetical protein
MKTENGRIKFRTGGAADRSSLFCRTVTTCMVALLASVIEISGVEALDKVRIAVSNPNMPNLTVAMAQQKGFFRTKTLKLKLSG